MEKVISITHKDITETTEVEQDHRNKEKELWKQQEPKTSPSKKGREKPKEMGERLEVKEQAMTESQALEEKTCKWNSKYKCKDISIISPHS